MATIYVNSGVNQDGYIQWNHATRDGVYQAGYAYIAEDGGAFCAACMNGENGSLASIPDVACEQYCRGAQWHVIGSQPAAGDALECAHCYATI